MDDVPSEGVGSWDGLHATDDAGANDGIAGGVTGALEEAAVEGWGDDGDDGGGEAVGGAEDGEREGGVEDRRRPEKRVEGIEPSSIAWKAIALPLSYTRGAVVRAPADAS